MCKVCVISLVIIICRYDMITTYTRMLKLPKPIKSLVRIYMHAQTKLYSLHPTLFILFEKSNFLREHHLLSCLPFKNDKFPKLPLNKFIKKLNY